MTEPLWAILPQVLFNYAQTWPEEKTLQALTAFSQKAAAHSSASHAACIAVLPLTGVISRYSANNYLFSGGTSLDNFVYAFHQALHNPAIQSIILNIDSPGGTVAGIHECAEMIYNARGQKKIIAYVSGMAASAAYWLACAADEIILDATASVGSIGVLCVQTDDSDYKAKIGVKDITIVSSVSPHKHIDATTPNGRHELQKTVDSIAEVFINRVACYRNVSTDTVLADFGQGGVLVGQQAIDVNMADHLGSLNTLLNDLSSLSGTPMTTLTQAQTDTLTIQTIETQYPTIAQHFRTEGAALERERIQSIEQHAIAGHEELINRLKYDGKTTSAEAAVQLLAAIKHNQANQLAQLKAEAPLPLPMPMVAFADTEKFLPTDENSLPEEEKLENNWRQDAKLRQEFQSKEAFIAYKMAETKGQVRILKR